MGFKSVRSPGIVANQPKREEIQNDRLQLKRKESIYLLGARLHCFKAASPHIGGKVQRKSLRRKKI